MKVVINICYGGFGISKEAGEMLANLGNTEAKESLDYYNEDPSSYNKDQSYGFYCDLWNTPRHDLDLIKVVEELKEKSWGENAKLKIVEIPDDTEYEIEDHHGKENIHEVHKIWS